MKKLLLLTLLSSTANAGMVYDAIELKAAYQYCIENELDQYGFKLITGIIIKDQPVLIDMMLQGYDTINVPTEFEIKQCIRNLKKFEEQSK